jgi:membrane-bound lytic murein transglycosylase F
MTLLRGSIIWILLFVAPAGPALGFEAYNRMVKFDKYFSKYSKRYFGPGFDWRFFKAQSIAESGLESDARSPVGAAGIMQIMPRTFEEIMRKNAYIKGTRLQPRWNIAAGIFYDRMLWKTWTAPRPYRDRIDFMFGSYNAGKGNILKAQKVAEKQGLNPNLWETITTALPRVTGRRSRETIDYVDKIDRIKEVLR